MNKKSLILIAAIVLSSFTFLWVAYDLLAGNLSGFAYFQVMHRFGHSAIILLLLSSFTVLMKNYRVPEGFEPHRIFGLFALLYAAAHFFTFLLSFGFNLQQIMQAFVSQPFIILGDLALLILLTLQLTSGDRMRKKNAKLWRKLHYLFYVAVAAIITHIFFVTKVAKPIFVVYAVLFAILIFFHLKFVRAKLLPAKKAK